MGVNYKKTARRFLTISFFRNFYEEQEKEKDSGEKIDEEVIKKMIRQHSISESKAMHGND